MKRAPNVLFAMALASAFVARSADATETHVDEYHGTSCQLTSDATSAFDLSVMEDQVLIARKSGASTSAQASFICPVNVSSKYNPFLVSNVSFQLRWSNTVGTTAAPTCSSTLVSSAGAVTHSSDQEEDFTYPVDHAYLYCTLTFGSSAKLAITGYKGSITYQPGQ